MCYEQGELQAYLDGEVSRQNSWEIEVHVADCERCRAALDELRQQEAVVTAGIEEHNRTVGDHQSNREKAWGRFVEEQAEGNKRSLLRGVDRMMRRNAKLAAAAGVVLSLALLLSLGPVRSSIAGFLGIFRVDKIETVQISPQDLARIEEAMKSGGEDLEIPNFGKIDVKGKEESRIVSLEETRKAVDFSVRIPDGAVAGFGAPTIRVQSPVSAKLVLDVEKANSLISSFGGKKMLPGTIDGKSFSLEVPAVVRAEYPAASQDARALNISQARSPEIKVPEDVDVEDIRDALLSIEILPSDLRSKLAAVDDWRHTMLVPNIDGSAKNVTVNGSDGVFITSPEHRQWRGESSALIWLQDGVITVIEGDLTLDAAMDIASGMK